MKAIPVIKVSDLTASIAFYTEVLDFTPRYPRYFNESVANGVMYLVNDDAHLQLSVHAGDGHFGSSTTLELHSPAEVDALFETYLARGLDNSRKPESPVHCAPLNQTWGARVFCVDDPDGNTLSFSAWH